MVIFAKFREYALLRSAQDFGGGFPLLHPITQKARAMGSPGSLTSAKRLNIAVRRGCDVDQPRNLAKSVTVE
jgi:hypothetical protein